MHNPFIKHCSYPVTTRKGQFLYSGGFKHAQGCLKGIPFATGILGVALKFRIYSYTNLHHASRMTS